MSPAQLDELILPDATAWRAWLERHHDSSPGVWLVLHRKGGRVTDLTRALALDEALCFGWIDGQARRRDEQSTFQRMTPRRARSPWSALNVAHVARLEAEGRMAPAGLAAVEAARRDGRWEAAYSGSASLIVPDDLAAAVAGEPEAQRMFDVLTKANLFAIVHRLDQAKRPETRTRNIERYVAMLARHETPYPQGRRPT